MSVQGEVAIIETEDDSTGVSGTIVGKLKQFASNAPGAVPNVAGIETGASIVHASSDKKEEKEGKSKTGPPTEPPTEDNSQLHQGGAPKYQGNQVKILNQTAAESLLDLMPVATDRTHSEIAMAAAGKFVDIASKPTPIYARASTVKTLTKVLAEIPAVMKNPATEKDLGELRYAKLREQPVWDGAKALFRTIGLALSAAALNNDGASTVGVVAIGTTQSQIIEAPEDVVRSIMWAWDHLPFIMTQASPFPEYNPLIMLEESTRISFPLAGATLRDYMIFSNSVNLGLDYSTVDVGVSGLVRQLSRAMWARPEALRHAPLKVDVFRELIRELLSSSQGLELS
jgi:hypothetical protein